MRTCEEIEGVEYTVTHNLDDASKKKKSFYFQKRYQGEFVVGAEDIESHMTIEPVMGQIYSVDAYDEESWFLSGFYLSIDELNLDTAVRIYTKVKKNRDDDKEWKAGVKWTEDGIRQIVTDELREQFTEENIRKIVIDELQANGIGDE